MTRPRTLNRCAMLAIEDGLQAWITAFAGPSRPPAKAEQAWRCVGLLLTARPHLYPEYRALARVHWRAVIVETGRGWGGGTIIVPRWRSGVPLMIMRSGSCGPLPKRPADARAGTWRRHENRAYARGPRPGAPWWVWGGQWLLASPELNRLGQTMCRSIADSLAALLHGVPGLGPCTLAGGAS